MERVALIGFNVADAERRKEGEGDNHGAILLGDDVDSGEASKESIFFDGDVEVFVIDAASCVALAVAAVGGIGGEMEGSWPGGAPVVVDKQRDFFGGEFFDSMRIDREDHVGVLLAADCGNEEATGRGAEDILKEAEVEIVFEFCAHEVVKLLRGLSVFATRLASGSGGFVQFNGGCVRESEHDLIEVFVELFAVGGNGQVVTLLRSGGPEMEVANALEHRSRDLAVDLAVKGDVAAAKSEGGGVAPELEVFDRDDFTAREQGAQLLIEGVGVGRVLCGERSGETGEEERQGKARKPRGGRHASGSSILNLMGTL